MTGRRHLLEPGSTLGSYQLLREVGKGGFAAVWLARQSGPGGFDRLVAIKTIRPEFGMDAHFRRMLLDEARLAAHIEHPNVARIIELGEDDEMLFLVMEYVRGLPLQTLRRRIEAQGETIPVAIVLRVLADTCAGLHAAHHVEHAGKHLSVIHRDVSPQNILVDHHGVAKLIDFGIAKAIDRLSDDTKTGLAKGKVRYMAPEQARGGNIDQRADLWSIGAVAYDLIQGHPPFDGPNDVARISALIGDGPPLPFTVKVPKAVEEIILRALSRNLETRYESAVQLKKALEHAGAQLGLDATHEDVERFFRPYVTEASRLTPITDQDLRVCLAGPVNQNALETQDIVAPSAPHDASPADSTSSDSSEESAYFPDSGHTLPPRGGGRQRGFGTAIALVAVAAVSTIGLARLNAPNPSLSSPAFTTTAALPHAEPIASSVLPEPTPKEAPVVTPPATSASSSKATDSRRKPPRTKPTAKPRTAAPSSSLHRPRYDDTIE